MPTRRPETEPAAAYDIWAQSYDHQPDNLMLALDEGICREFFGRLPIGGRVVADIGCGTGRHWEKIFAYRPARLVGYDVSCGMLDILRGKYPQAETYLLEGGLLSALPAGSIDLLISTLTVAHIPDIAAALAEWNRVLRPGGEMIITDYHPEALARGGQRTFRDGERVIAVRNHVYPIKKIRAIAARLGLREISLTEKKIDETMRPYYEKQQALATYQRFQGVPIIYGLHLKKTDVAE
ncbi:MAG TPA: class I SAM-dependent methyltransferase [Puia sp.]|jgi:ubiquinone/menaquinone biosynthesis C-methylase UbiE|nr:class I SAM-dependent methyltransferase [Puia sp.]